MEPEAIYVGTDIAKAQLAVAVRPTDDRWAVTRDGAGLRQLVARLQALAPALVVLEASGGLEVPLVAALAAAAVPVVVVNPRQVRDFTRATGQLAKTDALDAALLAHFAAAVRPPVQLGRLDARSGHVLPTATNVLPICPVAQGMGHSRTTPGTIRAALVHQRVRSASPAVPRRKTYPCQRRGRGLGPTPPLQSRAVYGRSVARTRRGCMRGERHASDAGEIRAYGDAPG